MDLASARDAGISFFTHKATEGGDWEDRYYKKALDRARRAAIPVLGSYHYLWPDPPNGIGAQVNFWMDCVAERTPWWHEGPWIWQIDAEQQGLPRPPSPEEIRSAVDAVNDRMAREGTTGYVIVYMAGLRCRAASRASFSSPPTRPSGDSTPAMSTSSTVTSTR
jgi:hypothetical protein